MPGLQGDNVVSTQGSPVKKSKLSLKFFQKKETKRSLDFSEPQTENVKTADPEEPEGIICEQPVFGPLPCQASPSNPIAREKKENLLPFVGLNNLGNTCYLNSVLQVLYYCPGFRESIRKLYDLSKSSSKPKEEPETKEQPQPQQEDCPAESVPAPLELLASFHSLLMSLEELQSGFLLNPDGFGEGELATPPRKILNTLRRLNSMYEGHLQHDAQEVLQCILAYIQEACSIIRKEQESEGERDSNGVSSAASDAEAKSAEEDGQQGAGKRKSDTEVGNAKKKPKSGQAKKSEATEEQPPVNKPFTRSKRKSSSDASAHGKDEGKTKASGQSVNGDEQKDEQGPKEADGKRKKRAKLRWLRPSGKQPSIFSKFCSVGRLSTTPGKASDKGEVDEEQPDIKPESSPEVPAGEDNSEKRHGGLGLMEKLFQGQLVLRTRCLECESFTERREDFHDISVPVLDDQPGSPDDFSEVSPEPKPELKTLKWAIAQFASVERIVGEDKYFCETCHHYTEAERSLLFDKTPEVVTIHLKRFSANGLELDPYAGLSKVNTPLHTPLTLSLEEWCTKPSAAAGQEYQLFAVIMHSGVTISSGHYTAYVRMSGLADTEALPQDVKVLKDEGVDTKAGLADYDDGEVSFSQKGQRRVSAAKSSSKKLSEGGVGLLGGQRSLPQQDIGKGSTAAAEGSKRRRSINGSKQNTETEEKETEEGGAAGGVASTQQQQVRSSLLPYEGKWLLFDDSEVTLYQEEEFLRSCSPDTCSSSTPYLLFYRKIPPRGL